MEAGTTYCVVMTTMPSRDGAEALARFLLNEGMAACVQLLPIDSLYRWKGEITESEEILLLIKTRTERYEALEGAIRSRHEYEVPEIVRLPVDTGSDGYLRWIDEETLNPRE